MMNQRLSRCLVVNFSTVLSVAFVTSNLSCGRNDGSHKKVEAISQPTASGISYESVRPILQNRCSPCHNFGAQYGAILPLAKDGKNSLVFRYVIDKKPREMPPPNSSQSRAMTEQERAQIRQWNEAGAPAAAVASAPSIPQTSLSPQAQMLRECWSCHGEDGRSSLASRPNLAGQKAGYLQGQLFRYRDMTRTDNSEGVMNRVAAKLDDGDIRFLSQYFSYFGRPDRGIAPQMSADEIKQSETVVRIQSCGSCHRVDSGIQAGELNGQNASYLQHQLMSFKSGARKSIVMEMVAKDLSDDEIRLLSAWFANGSPRP